MNEHEDYENENLCIAYEGFFLLPEHLEGLREIRRMRLEIDPSGRIPAWAPKPFESRQSQNSPFSPNGGHYEPSPDRFPSLGRQIPC